jgi:predicted lipase
MSFLYDMAVLSADTYEEAHTPDWVIGNTEVYTTQLSHTQRVVAFRGTSANFDDILADMRAIPWYHNKLGMVHKGFLLGGLSVWPVVREYLKQHGSEKFIFTGHSKGAAEATVVAALASLEFGHIGGLVTFGSPRVGFSLNAKINSNAGVSRFVNANDLVPRHPWAFWGYRHVGDETRLGGGSGNRFHDHKINAYISAIESLL